MRADGSSSLGYGLRVHRHPNLAAEQIEQDGNAIAVFHAFVQGKAVGERTIENSDLFGSRHDFECSGVNNDIDAPHGKFETAGVTHIANKEPRTINLRKPAVHAPSSSASARHGRRR
jgi:hypothetical protein